MSKLRGEKLQLSLIFTVAGLFTKAVALNLDFINVRTNFVITLS